MSTYRDIKNRIKESVIVNYNDRSSNQEVKFLNRNNEFWGKFYGEVEGINGSTLSNCLIVDSVLSNVSVGTIPLDNLGNELSILSVNINDNEQSIEVLSGIINDITNNELPQINNIISSLSSTVYSNEISCDTITTDSENINININKETPNQNAFTLLKVNDELLSTHLKNINKLMYKNELTNVLSVYCDNVNMDKLIVGYNNLVDILRQIFDLNSISCC